MLKKTIWTLSLVGVLGLVNCGGEGSKEAKELLQKILQFIGIPQSIIVNVCQDSNRDGICSLTERQTKVTINKGDSVETIWEKISLTEDGRYFLETYNPEEPILVELQDVAKVTYDEGKFTLAFNGFTTKEDDNETKEISILESMVDANALSKDIADKFRNLDNKEAQDKYYVALLNTLEININTLRRNGLDSQTAVRASIVEMGDETKINQEQAPKINACGSDQTCVDGEIKTLSDELIITEDEAVEIKDKENSSESVGNGEVQKGKWVKVSQSVCEANRGRYNDSMNECSSNWEDAKIICSVNGDKFPTIQALNRVVTDCGGIIDNFDSNSKNESYQTCYKNKGFESTVYWSSSLSETSSILSVNFYFGNNRQLSKNDETYFHCIRE